MATTPQDVMDKVAAAIIKSIEEGMVDGTWKRPWVSTGSNGLPFNALTGKPYSGGNIFALWLAEWEQGYGTSRWATYKQWTELGAQVRKGETGTHCVKYTPVDCRDHGKDVRCDKCGRMAVRSFALFNEAQVDGWSAPEAVAPVNASERLETLDAFFGNIGADVRVGGDSAHYAPVNDYIAVPAFEYFVDADAYYATLAHEFIHWTGHEDRLARDLSGRFGTSSYAVEELVAELGAAMLCSILNVSDTPRADHARYLKHWLEVLKEDSKALWAAASLASKAVAFIESKNTKGGTPAEETLSV